MMTGRTIDTSGLMEHWLLWQRSLNLMSGFCYHYDTLGYSDEFKRECLKMYVNGMGIKCRLALEYFLANAKGKITAP